MSSVFGFTCGRLKAAAMVLGLFLRAPFLEGGAWGTVGNGVGLLLETDGALVLDAEDDCGK